MKFKIALHTEEIIKNNALTIEEILEDGIIVDIPYTRPDLFCIPLLFGKIKKEKICEYGANITFNKFDYNKLKNFKNIVLQKQIQCIIECKFTTEVLEYLKTIKKLYNENLIYINMSDKSIYINAAQNLIGNFLFCILYLIEDATIFCNYTFINKQYNLEILKYTNVNLEINKLEHLYYQIKDNVIICPIHRQDIKCVNHVLGDLMNLNFENFTFSKISPIFSVIPEIHFNNYLENKGFKYILPSAFISLQTNNKLNLENSSFIINPISANKSIFTLDLIPFLIQEGFKRQNLKSPVKIYTKMNALSVKTTGIVIFKNINLENLIYDLTPINAKIKLKQPTPQFEFSISVESNAYNFSISLLKDKFVEIFKYRPETNILVITEN